MWCLLKNSKEYKKSYYQCVHEQQRTRTNEDQPRVLPPWRSPRKQRPASVVVTQPPRPERRASVPEVLPASPAEEELVRLPSAPSKATRLSSHSGKSGEASSRWQQCIRAVIWSQPATPAVTEKPIVSAEIQEGDSNSGVPSGGSWRLPDRGRPVVVVASREGYFKFGVPSGGLKDIPDDLGSQKKRRNSGKQNGRRALRGRIKCQWMRMNCATGQTRYRASAQRERGFCGSWSRSPVQRDRRSPTESVRLPSEETQYLAYV